MVLPLHVSHSDTVTNIINKTIKTRSLILLIIFYLNYQASNSAAGGENQLKLVSAPIRYMVRTHSLRQNHLGGKRREFSHISCALMKVSLPPWISLEIAGGLASMTPNDEPDIKTDGHAVRPRGSEEARATILLPEIIPATTLAFRPGDTTTYLLGTVSGDILLCKTFERRGAKAMYRSHKAMITRLAWRPSPPEDISSIFLSSALDDTIRIWHVEKLEPICVLKNTQQWFNKTL
ncbi:hypothetical protein SK128_002049 [Halocaridina rubra]|uniref:Uncharacterized protein n=1 Tax=Halocaridina rubra TaxID=373956 RepID=A0AAN8X2U3_HALRR